MTRCYSHVDLASPDGQQVFLLEQHLLSLFYQNRFPVSGLPGKFLNTPLQFVSNGWSDTSLVNTSLCNDIPPIPHIGFFDVSLWDQCLILINIVVFLILLLIACYILNGIGILMEWSILWLWKHIRKLWM